MTDRTPIFNIITELATTLNASLEKNGFDPNDFNLHELYLILSSFTGVTLSRAFSSMSHTPEHKQELLDEYCQALRGALEKLIQ